MAWGTKIANRSPSAHFLSLWCERIEKEERAICRASEEASQLQRREHGSSRSNGSRHSRRHKELVSAGNLSVRPARRSRSSSSLSQATTEAERDRPYLPHDLRPLSHFPLVDDSMMKMRARPTDEGKVPKIRFRAESVSAFWVPGSKSYTRYKPEFYFEDVK
mmetsp:Transcript_103399/g.205531  ORF Transcript_103399/g.205531 Transcript_103399/m.205531 type:complete len:162 (-) Transcript_103399:83-568(-)